MTTMTIPVITMTIPMTTTFVICCWLLLVNTDDNDDNTNDNDDNTNDNNFCHLLSVAVGQYQMITIRMPMTTTTNTHQ